MAKASPILGAHMSVAGGYHHAVEAAVKATCHCVQLFTKNNNQWNAKPISDEAASLFRTAIKSAKFRHSLSHSSYLINLAAPDAELWKRSVDAMVVELQRAERLGIPYVVLHPGAFTTSSEELGIQAIIRALDEIIRQTRDLTSQCLLETTAGQGSCLGCRFEQLAAMLDGVQHPDRLGICVDTCHIFAAGYPLIEPKEYRSTMKELDSTIGISQVKAIHLNDSKRELGSCVDRHEHIGLGCLGLEPFRHLLNDPKLRKIPMYLETPKGTCENGENQGEDWDVINLRLLRSLVA